MLIQGFLFASIRIVWGELPPLSLFVLFRGWEYDLRMLYGSIGIQSSQYHWGIVYLAVSRVSVVPGCVVSYSTERSNRKRNDVILNSSRMLYLGLWVYDDESILEAIAIIPPL